MLRTLAVAVAALLAVPLFAQDLESLGGMRLRFDAPGARNTAMGGASEALTDSFNAATNPASLAKQKTRAAAIELRETSNETDFLTSGTIGSFTRSSFDTTSRGLRSAVLVAPARAATWALYYDEPLRFAREMDLSGYTGQVIGVGVRGKELVPVGECTPTGAPSDCSAVALFSAPAVFPTTADLRLRRYGAAAARSFGRLALGASAQYARLEQDGVSVIARQLTDDGQVTWNAGFQFDLTPRLHVGGSYRSGARFESERRISSINDQPFTGPASFSTPASYAVGLGVDATSSLTVAVDAVRVKYSDMLSLPDFIPPPLGPFGALWYQMPDVTEVRAGAEYRLPTRVPVALRAGAWREPAHRARAYSNGVGIAEPINAVLLLDQDENHVTAGIGVGSRVRVDAAYDRSENTSRASVALSSTF